MATVYVRQYEYPNNAGIRFLGRALNKYGPKKPALYIKLSRVTKEAAWVPLRWGMSRGWLSIHTDPPGPPPPPPPDNASVSEMHAPQSDAAAGTLVPPIP